MCIVHDSCLPEMSSQFSVNTNNGMIESIMINPCGSRKAHSKGDYLGPRQGHTGIHLSAEIFLPKIYTHDGF